MEQPRYLTANPPGVRTYRDTHAFIAEDPHRQSSWDAPGDIRGWDVSDGFRLAELTLAGSPDSEWRICVVDRMVCAVLRRFPTEQLYTFDGPVWVIADVPSSIPVTVTGALMSVLREAERIKTRPDSLLAAVKLIRAGVARLEADQQQEPSPTAASGHQTAAEAVDRYRQFGDPGHETVRCFVCGHSVWTHYEDPVGGGCVSTTPPIATLDQLVTAGPAHPEVVGAAGCLCPGFLQGRLPHAMRKHLDGIGEGTCVSCSHDLDEHSTSHGCLDCPCQIGYEAPQEQ